MKIAICFSGQIRTGVRCYENITNFIGYLLPNCDFFMHTWDSVSHAPTIVPFDDVLFDIGKKEIDDIISLYNPIKYEVENFYDAHKNGYIKYDNVPFNPRFYSWEKSIDFKRDYEIENNFKYDYVIKLRYDSIFSPNISLISLIKELKDLDFGVEHTYVDNFNKLVLDDNIFISNSIIMDIASKWNSYHSDNYKEIHLPYPKYVNEHALLVDYLIQNNINIKNLDLQDRKLISIYRPEAFRFDAVKDYYKCYEVNHLTYWNGLFNTYLTYDEIVQLIDDLTDNFHFKIDNILKIKENFKL